MIHLSRAWFRGVRAPLVRIAALLVALNFHQLPKLQVKAIGQLSAASSRPIASSSVYLLAQITGDQLEPGKSELDAKLAQLLLRDGPDIRSNRANFDFKDITLEVSARAWRLLHQHLDTLVNSKVDQISPAIQMVLERSNTSLECRQSVAHTLAAAKRMESWALQLMNSWGSLPGAGLFEGTYTDLGSYHTCVNTPENSLIGHAHYCTLTYRPVMPSHKDYHIVLNRESKFLLNQFSGADEASITPTLNGSSVLQDQTARRDVLTEILEHSQYFHYVYFKLGSCWPINCSPFDVRRVAKFIGWSNILLNGPVKCFSHFGGDYEQPGSVAPNGTVTKLKISTADLNQGLFIWKPYFSGHQRVAYYILGFVLCSLILCTMIDILFFRLVPFMRGVSGSKEDHSCPLESQKSIKFAIVSTNDEHHSRDPTVIALSQQLQRSALQNSDPTNPHMTRQLNPYAKIVKDVSIVTNWKQFFSVNESQLKNDILCLNGIRCITMVWIIITHTLLYNDWGAFGRTKEIEKSIKNVGTQPLFNGSYLVDTFFLMSGLLTAFTVLKNGRPKNFRSHIFLIGRWLRLTPQIFLVSMIYIVLPHLNTGPNWYQQVGEYSENCSTNWWVNLLHLQAFYDSKFMCNFPTWWISIDSYYHLFALFIVWIYLIADSKWAAWSVVLIILFHAPMQAYHHFIMALPPNILSTIPQTGAMWADMTLRFYWRPYSHSIPFFIGFLTGCLLTPNTRLIETYLTPVKAGFLSSLAAFALVLQSYSTWWWVSGQVMYTRPIATVFNLSAQFVWALCFAWIIVACHKGFGGPINRLLSSNCFVILGKASYMIYLTHFQIIFTSYGSQNLLIDPAPFQMSYLIVGNIVFSLIYGILMCILIEFPLLKIQKRIMSYL